MTEISEKDLALKVYDTLAILLAHSRIRCGLLEDRIKRLEAHQWADNDAHRNHPVITADLNEAIDMALCVWKQGCDVYKAKYGDRKWGNELLSAFLRATDPEGNHE